jgi:hypothetical protein
MTIHSIGKTRESLNWSSENYKEAIREYLDTEGYSQISDSFIEGDLADMVFINPSLAVGEKTLVESKATTIGSSDEKLALEVVKYLVEWLKLDPQKRFKFFIFAKGITKKGEFKKYYGSKCSKKSVQGLIDRVQGKLDKNGQEIIETADLRKSSASLEKSRFGKEPMKSLRLQRQARKSTANYLLKDTLTI